MNITVIRDIAVTIAAVLLIISIVHYSKWDGIYLGLPILNSDSKDFTVKANMMDRINVDAQVSHQDSCVDGHRFNDPFGRY